MEFSGKVLSLSFNRFISTPFINWIVYRFQTFLVERNLTNVVFASALESKEQKEFFKIINRRCKVVIVKSYEFARSLRFLKTMTILDLPKIDPRLLKTRYIYRLMWALVFSKHVTRNTKKNLEGFITQDIGVKDVVIIPVHLDINIICDFIIQTALELERRGYVVVLVYFFNSRWILKSAEKLDLKRINRRFGDRFENVFFYFPLRIFPLKLHKFRIVQEIDGLISNVSVYLRVVIHFVEPILWCFDYRDYRAASLYKGNALRVYDCVDYWSSFDEPTSLSIKEKEQKLIESVDYFFVNSHSLFTYKKRFRQANAILPQGFDIESFSSSILNRVESIEIKKLKTIFRRIPKPRVGYIGNISSRLDYKLLFELIEFRNDISYVFTNAQEFSSEDKHFEDLDGKRRKLKSYRNVYFIPKTRHKKVVKEIIRNFDMGMIPYNILYDFNRYCYPMKLFEYFYMGKPVISTPIEELKRFPKFVKIGENAREWEKHINEILSRTWLKKYQKEQRKLSEENSWEKKLLSISEQISDI